MALFVSSSGVWKQVNNMFVSSSGVWKKINAGYVSSGGVWKKFFSTTLAPSIATQVTISTASASYPAVLTGTNFYWTNSTSLSYLFQKSSDNINWTSAGSGSTGTIANPSSGSSNTVTYTPVTADFSTSPMYFRFAVTANNAIYSTSTTSYSTSVSQTYAAAPTAPTSLTATGTSTGVNLSWSGATGSITSYELFWNVTSTGTPSPASPPDFYPGNSTSYSDTGISAGSTRYYWVRASGPGGVSAWYPAVLGVAGTRTANATAPTSVSVSVSRNVFTVSWSGATSATQYHIYWVNSTSTSANPAVSFDGSTTNSTIDFTLSYSSSYYFFVSAAGSNNVWTPYNSARSAQATSGAQITTPSAPTGVSATTTRTDGINVTWNASSGATSYEIWWGGPPLDSYTPDFYPGNTTSYLDTSVTAGSSRTYYVRARNSSGASSWSSGASGTRSSGSAPTSVSVSGNNSLAVGGTFSWSATGATSYNITIDGPTGNLAYLPGTSITSYRPGYDGVWQGAGTYYCYVTAVNAYGSTNASPYPLATFMN